MAPLITVKCIRHVYPDKTEVSLCGLDFVVQKGQRVVILGPNGAGKTTLLHHILGLLVPVEGVVEVLGMNPSKSFHVIRKHIGVVFQNVDEQIIGPRVYDDIAFTLRNDRVPKQEIDPRVQETARCLGIDGLLDKIPHYLSGGQKKKVALAGAAVTRPDLLILDEPFDGLDPKGKQEMIAHLNALNESLGITLLITTHDINVVPQIADMIYVINDGFIVAKGTCQEVFAQGDLLQRANLEPPILLELFSRLKAQGCPVDIPKDVDEAERMLKACLAKPQKHLA